MTGERNVTGGRLARWREHRRAKRQRSLERRYGEDEGLRASTKAYTDADNHARRWSSFLGGGGSGP